MARNRGPGWVVRSIEGRQRCACKVCGRSLVVERSSRGDVARCFVCCRVVVYGELITGDNSVFSVESVFYPLLGEV